MCEQCGCGLGTGPGARLAPGAAVERDAGQRIEVEVLRGLLDANDRRARHNRAHLDHHGVLALNLMSAPGSGKTALIEATLAALGGALRVGVIEGDLETENDAARVRRHGVPVVQITTGTACHLDAALVHQGLHALPLERLDVLIIENVGNLVCPASFDLGHHLNLTALSVTEGDDKPAKYPVMFRAADLVLITKTDLLVVLDDFDPAVAEAHLRRLANPAPVMAISARSGAGLEDWLAWLRAAVAAQRRRRAAGQTRVPATAPRTGSAQIP